VCTWHFVQVCVFWWFYTVSFKNCNWQPRIWHLFTRNLMVYLEAFFTNVANDLRICLTAVENGHFLNFKVVLWTSLEDRKVRIVTITLSSRNCPSDSSRELFEPFYGFGKPSGLDKKNWVFVSGFVFFVGDVTISGCFCLFGWDYLALGANPTSHFIAQVFFWKLKYHPSL